MKQKLKKTSFIYSQFDDLVFDSLSTNIEDISRMSTLLKMSKNHVFQIFMNDHVDSIKNFEALYDFLTNQYFSRMTFEFIYLSKQKINLFMSNLKLFDFEKNSYDIRSSLKYREKINN